jgi:ABC-type multidrug transport system permease subunit
MSAFYISKLIIELPLMFFSVITSSSIVFLVIGFENTLDFWVYWSNFTFSLVFSFCFVAFGGYMIGVSIGVMCKSQFYAVQAGVMIMFPVMTFGGQGVNLNTIPSYASWMQYLTPLRYGYNILMRKHLSS